MEYLVIYEQTATGYSAYVPDLPGCVAAGDTREETEQLIREGIALHITAMREDGEQIPVPTTTAGHVQIAA